MKIKLCPKNSKNKRHDRADTCLSGQTGQLKLPSLPGLLAPLGLRRMLPLLRLIPSLAATSWPTNISVVDPLPPPIVPILTPLPLGSERFPD